MVCNQSEIKLEKLIKQVQQSLKDKIKAPNFRSNYKQKGNIKH